MAGQAGLGGWRALAAFWVAVLILGAAAGAGLQMLGPPTPAESRPAPPPPAQRAAAPAPTDGRIAAPDPVLLEPSRLFPPAMLPRIAADGRMPSQAYARRSDAADTRPRIGLILAGVGLQEAESRAAIDTAPGPVTLAVSPYAQNMDGLMEQARARGHEVLVSLPMEPQGYPLNDAGSRSLLTGADPAENRRNLEWALGRVQGYVGLTGASEGLRGERFADSASGMAQVMEEVGKRGLVYIDPRPGKAPPLPPGVPGRGVDLVIDDPPARAEIEAKLAALERLAREKGSALGLAGPLRGVTLERVSAWAKGLEERGLVLVPVSALTAPAAAR